MVNNIKGGTYKAWKLRCTSCPTHWTVWGWNYDIPWNCPECTSPSELADRPRSTIMIATDDIPGGYDVRHGVCHEDGTPRRFYSKTELKRALNEKGLVISGDTPGKPYRVNWSGRRDND
jgi:hypothetical protein